MAIVAVFHWNGSGKKAVSYMVVDGEDFALLCAPQNFETSKDDNEKFEKEAGKVIEDFFNELMKIRQSRHDEIKIEYKIMGRFQPGVTFYRKDNASPETDFINKKFNEKWRENKTELKPIKLGPQLRSNLSGDALKDFKEKIHSYGYIDSPTRESFRWHLWALAVHATNGKYQPQLKKMLAATTMLSDQRDIQKPVRGLRKQA